MGEQRSVAFISLQASSGAVNNICLLTATSAAAAAAVAFIRVRPLWSRILDQIKALRIMYRF